MICDLYVSIYISHLIENHMNHGLGNMRREITEFKS